MKKIFITLVAITAILTISSCKTVKEIPMDYTAAQIIQLGQSAYDSSNYQFAEECFEAVINRYGMNVATFIEAKYELGHTYLTEKKYTEAYNIYTELLNLYEQTPSGDLPSAYKKLAQIGISQIPENKRPAAAASPLVEE